MKKQVDLLKGPIFFGLTKLAVPIMATSLIQMAYNMVDMIWIGKIGSQAVASVGAAGMYLWLSSGIATLAKVGGQVKVGHALGGGRKEEAVSYGKTALQMCIFLGLLYGLVCVLFTKPLIGFFRLNSASVVKDAQVYLKITCGGAVFSFLNMVITGIFMAMGDSATSFKSTTIGLVINMIFDPVLIFGLGPFPVMGVAGAAIATLFAQMIVTLLLVRAAAQDETVFRHIRIFSPIHWKHGMVMLKIAFPTTVQNILFTSISMVLARIIAAWGDTAIAVQKVGSQIESISWMTAEGFSAALGAFVAQNFGANNYKRVKNGYWTGMVVVLLWGAFCTLLLVVFPGPIFRIFIQEEEALEAGIGYLRILGYSQLFMCVEIATSGAFSGLGRTIPPSVEGIILTTMRIPLAIMLAKTPLALNGVWWSISISSILKGTVLFIWFILVLRRIMPEKKSISL